MHAWHSDDIRDCDSTDICSETAQMLLDVKVTVKSRPGGVFDFHRRIERAEQRLSDEVYDGAIQLLDALRCKEQDAVL